MIGPAVSVCIPAYCNPLTLQRTLQSVATQEFTDYEVVVTDDSPDESLETIVRCADIPARVSYQRNATRLGSPENWNHCVSLAIGEFVKILHHDDWLSSRHSLGEYVELMRRNPRSNLGFSATIVSNPDGTMQRIHRPSRWLLAVVTRNPRRLFPWNLIGSPSASIYRRSGAISFDSRLRWVVDLDFYIRMLLENPHLAFTAAPLVCTTNGLPTQVTSQSLGNKRVELFEWTYLYARLFYRSGVSANPLQIKFMWDLLGRHGIASWEDFAGSIDDAPVPPMLEQLVRARIRVAKVLPRVRRA